MRAKLGKAAAWLDLLASVSGLETAASTSSARKILHDASAGRPISIAPYHDEMEQHQKTWRLGGLASSRARVWEVGFPEEKKMVAELRAGLSWEWKGREEQWRIMKADPGKFADCRPGSMSAAEVASWDQNVADAVPQGWLEPVLEGDKIGCINHSFSVPKDDGTLRWVMDCSRFKSLLETPHMRMEGEEYLRQNLPAGAWMVSIDWRKFYWLFQMHPAEAAHQLTWGPSRRDRRRAREGGGGARESGSRVGCSVDLEQRIKELVGGRGGKQVTDARGRRLWRTPVAVMGSQPSGVRCAGYARLLVRKLAEFALELSTYCDDVLGFSGEVLVAFLCGLTATVASYLLGLAVSWQKLAWKPSQQRAYIGLEWDTHLMRTVLLQSRVADTQATARLLHECLQERRPVELRMLSRILGQLIAGASGSRGLALWGTPVRRVLRRFLNSSEQQYRALVLVPNAMVPMLEYVEEWPVEDRWQYLRQQLPAQTLSADASEFKWAMHRVPNQGPHRRICEFFTQVEIAELHHNLLELEAQIRGVKWMVQAHGWKGTALKPYCLRLETDNKFVSTVFTKWRTVSLEGSVRAWHFRRWLDERFLQIEMIFRSGLFMVHRRETDLDSRSASHWYEWMLRRPVYLQVLEGYKLVPEVMVDLFAQPSTAQSPRFVTRHHWPSALWHDAMSRPWSHQLNPSLLPSDVLWMFPPPVLLPKVLERLEAAGPRNRCILIFPHTPSSLWALRLQRFQPQPWQKLGWWAKICRPQEEGKVAVSKIDSPPTWEVGVLQL
jgi:hypothetical protein